MATAVGDLIKVDTERFPLTAGMHVHDGIIYQVVTPGRLLDNINTFSVKPNDWIIATYPKSGTTWVAEILHQISRNTEKTDVELPSYARFPFIEFELPKELYTEGTDVKPTEMSARGYKTHLTVEKLPRLIFDDNLKVVVVLRNPKDVAVSMYYMYKATTTLGNFGGSWDTFFDMFVSGNVFHGSWFHWVKKWYGKCRNDPNVLFLTYESMKQNPKQMIQTLGNFLGIALSDAIILEITKLTSFHYMKENKGFFPPGGAKLFIEDISPFLRKGEIGDWKAHFTVKQNELFDLLFQSEMKDFKDLTIAWDQYMK